MNILGKEVKFLTRNGNGRLRPKAEGFHLTRNLDPLVLAALRGNLDSVKALIRDGTDINHGESTCLMAACEIGHDEMVNYLIQSGADVNKTDAEGYSAIYTCTESGVLECMKLLLDNGADINTRSYAVTPLLLACAMRHTSVVEYLLGSPSCRRADKIEGQELMGAKCVNDGEFEIACSYWLHSLEERLSAEPGDLIPPKSQLTHPAYGDQFHTLQDLNRISSSKVDMWMQALIIIEQLTSHYYPNDNRDYVDSVIDVCTYLENVNYNKCTSVAMYILERHLQGHGVPDMWLQYPLSIFRRVISLLWSRDPPRPYEVVLPMLIKSVHLTKLSMQIPKDVQAEHPYSIHDDILAFVFISMDFLATCQPDMLDKDRINFKQIVYEFVKLNPRDSWNRRLLYSLFHAFRRSYVHCELVEVLLEAGVDPTVVNNYKETPLHIACKRRDPPYISIDVLKLLLKAGVDHGAINCGAETALHVVCINQDDSSYPVLEVVQLFLQAGASPHAVDGAGNTPMHYMAMNINHPSKCNVIKLLLSKCCSCVIDVCHSRDRTWFHDHWLDRMVREIKKPCDLRSLQCLSAKAVLTYSILYESVLPTCLTEFVKMHPSIKAGYRLQHEHHIQLSISVHFPAFAADEVLTTEPIVADGHRIAVDTSKVNDVITPFDVNITDHD